MSERIKNNNNYFLSLLKTSFYGVLVALALGLVFALLISLILFRSGSPESYYGIGGVFILVFSSFFTSLIYLKNKTLRKTITALYFTVMYFLLFLFISLIYDAGSIDLYSMIITFAVIFFSSFTALSLANNNKRRKPFKKRK